MQADLTKTALWGEVAGNVGKFLAESMPKAFGAIQQFAGKAGLTAANAKATQMGGALVGAGVGAAYKAVKAPEGQKGQAALSGALVGGAAGFGTGWAASKLPTLGNKIMKDFVPAGQKLMQVAKTNPTGMGLANEMAAWGKKNLVEQWKPTVPGAQGNIKTMWGTNSKVEMFREGPKKTMTAKGIGAMAESWDSIRTKGVQGAVDVLKEDFNKGRYFDRGGLLGKRSLLGQVVNPLVTTGVGMGALDAATATNKDGSKASLGKRIRKGTSSTLAWGLAPPIAVGKLMYDTSKSLKGPKSPPLQSGQLQ